MRTKIYRVRLSESDLVKIAKKIQDYTKSLNITIVTADKTDVHKGNDYNYFRSDDMPAEIYSISMTSDNYESNISCEISIECGSEGGILIEVSGTPSNAIGLFNDLEAMIREKRIFGHRLLTLIVEKVWAKLILPLLLAFFLYMIFDLVLDFVVSKNEQIMESNSFIVVAAICWSIVFVTIFTGVIWVEKFAAALLSPVEFSGTIVDRNARYRKARNFVIGYVLGPIALGLVGKFVYDIFWG